MKNLTFLKGLFVGIAIATVGAVTYANNISSMGSDAISWILIDKNIYFCYAGSGARDVKMANNAFDPACTAVRMIPRESM
jgi:hypothetical protein